MNESATIRALIVDDEPLARQRIEDLLRHHQEVEITGTASNGDEAIEAIRTLHPDLVFLDMQMPGKSGMEVIESLGEEMPAAIFVTAFDQYALKAFELAAVDYLVKPFDDERFEQAYDRARQRIEMEEVRSMSDRLLSILQRGTGSPPGPSPREPRPRFLERIAVEGRGQSRIVPVQRIDYITASGPYAEIHVGGHAWALRERMHHLEENLDPRRFFRVHRSAIVRLDAVEAMLTRAGGDYAVRMKDGAELSVSRARRDELSERLGVSRREPD